MTALDTRPEALAQLFRLGVAAGSIAVEEQVEALRRASRPYNGYTTVTLWRGGVFHTEGGEHFHLAWADFAGALVEIAPEVHKKGTGPWFSPITSANGGCRDADVVAIHQLSFDCDGAGAPDIGVAKLDRAKIAYVLQNSASSTDECPKYHLHIPLSSPLSLSKPQWRQLLRFAIGYFGTLFDLKVDLETSPPQFGFDHSTDRLGQPYFIPTRRHPDAPIPTTTWQTGSALDLLSLASTGGFRWVDRTAKAKTRRAPREIAQSLTSGVPGLGLLARSFVAAGLAGSFLPSGVLAVRCPWEALHTGGSPFDGSTVVFPPKEGTQGWFFCSHAHCSGRSQREVLLALPPGALMAGRVE